MATELQKEALRIKARRAKSRRDSFEFTKYTFRTYKNENWHHKVCLNFADRLINREILRGMMFLPPRHMKTEGIQRAFSRALGANPDEKLMVCAFGADKAERISKQIKNNITDERFKRIFPDFTGINGANQVKFWEIGGEHRGGGLAAGVGGPITGEGFNLGYIDDPVKSRKDAESATYQDATFEWYEGTFLNRQDEQDSVILNTNTRWNRKDLSGKILERDGIATYNTHKPSEGCPEWNGDENGIWHILCLPAIMDEEAYAWKHPDDPREIGEALWPQRFPVEFLAQFQKNRYDWASLYQQRPKPKGGNIIDRKWFKIVDRMPHGAKIVRFWDLAGTPKEESKKNDPDFTAGGLVGFANGSLFIADVRASRDTPKKVMDMVKQTAVLDDSEYNQVRQYWEEEGGAGGKHITDTYRDLLSSHWREPYRVGKNKEFYIDLLANKAEAGEVYLIQGKWLHEKHDGNTFLDEAEEFPKGRHDDRIDAVAKAAYILTGDPIDIIEALKQARAAGRLPKRTTTTRRAV